MKRTEGRICVGAVLVREQDHRRDGAPLVLLGQRTPGRTFWPDVWDVPGGHCELGVTSEQTLAREIGEELGVTPTAWRPPETFRSFLAGCDEGIVLHLYVVTGWTATSHNRAPDEHAEIDWFTVEDACNLPLAHPGYLAL